MRKLYRRRDEKGRFAEDTRLRTFLAFGLLVWLVVSVLVALITT